MRKNNKSDIRRERIIMIASSAFVMAALTATGVYIKSNTKPEDDGYSIDFGQLEGGVEDGQPDDGLGGLIDPSLQDGWDLPGGMASGVAAEDDLDYDPASEAGSTQIEIPGLTSQETGQGLEGDDSMKKDFSGQSAPKGVKKDPEEPAKADGTDTKQVADVPEEAGTDGTSLEASAGEAAEILEDAGQQEASAQPGPLQFREESGLVRPVAGEVLMHYSMDGSIYFATLDQYKYNSAVMLKASEGDSVCACAQGQVLAVFEDEEIGQAVTLALGDGYQATYGQLKNLTVSLGGYVNEGDILGYVAAPTKYYSVEGTNLYFQLTKDGMPVNPEVLFR